MLTLEAEKIIAKKESNGYREYRIPGLLCLQDAIFLAYEARAEETGDWGDIDVAVLRLSPDGELQQVLKIGKSHLPKDGTMRTWNNPTLIPDGNRIHLIYHQNYERAFIVSSENQGDSWSVPREITAAYREFPFSWNVCATGPGHGLQMKNGRLIAPIWLASGNLRPDGTREHMPSVSGCIFSDDHGETWHAGAMTQGITDANETSAALLPDGRLLFNIRNRNEKMRRMLALSSDGGETFDRIWTAEDLVDPRCFGGMDQAAQGDVFFVNCHCENARTNLTLQKTDNAGETWQIIQEIDFLGGYADLGLHQGKSCIFYERYSPERHIVDELVLKIFRQQEALSKPMK